MRKVPNYVLFKRPGNGKLFVNKSEKIFVFGNNKFRTHVDLLLAGHLSSVIGQKGESQNGRFKKTKHAKFPEK